MSRKDAKKDKDKAKKDAGGTFLARVFVSLKPTVNDPEGITIGNALGSLGFDGVRGVRSGKFFQVTIEADDAKTASAQVDQMCARLLANPVIETYSFELVKPGK
ncbi:MAG TPA: phosphoribosylformylglycinamidine synthase subunit PurS [Tepidiformaceae bacterium]|nr:phosphoribosylformylglycinamidine synthase subunit PurS [Tepidiformaceae bacterium]HMO95101.1 phosphoribosylformylglycinamidine synthase subunit PurS [Tepidiformaceae bacterium]